jgi:hypothetical protein
LHPARIFYNNLEGFGVSKAGNLKYWHKTALVRV